MVVVFFHLFWESVDAALREKSQTGTPKKSQTAAQKNTRTGQEGRPDGGRVVNKLSKAKSIQITLFA